MAVALFPLVVLIVGLLMYALLTNPKLAEIGRIAIFCGLLGLTFAYISSTVVVGETVQHAHH